MINSTSKNSTLINIETEFGKVTVRDNWVISQILYKWIKNGGKEFACSREDIAKYAKCHPQHVSVILRKYNALFYRRYVHTGRGENRRTHLHIDVNLLELCITFGERIYEAVARSLSGFLRSKTEAIFKVLARTFCSPKKTQEEDLNTNKLGDVSVSDCASPSTESITSNTASVDMEIDDYLIKMDYETCAFAPAVWDKRASAVSSEEVTPHISKILKHNKPYAHVIAALEEKKRLKIPSPGSLEHIKESVKNKMDLNMGQDIETAPAKEIHPLRRLLNKRLGLS